MFWARQDWPKADVSCFVMLQTRISLAKARTIRHAWRWFRGVGALQTTRQFAPCGSILIPPNSFTVRLSTCIYESLSLCFSLSLSLSLCHNLHLSIDDDWMLLELGASKQQWSINCIGIGRRVVVGRISKNQVGIGIHEGTLGTNFDEIGWIWAPMRPWGVNSNEISCVEASMRGSHHDRGVKTPNRAALWISNTGGITNPDSALHMNR